MKKNNKKGFTIVELVIVIAVIGILAAVLIPTFANVTKSAKEKAALQDARNTYVEYCAANPEENLGGNYIVVTEKIAIAIVAGQINTTVYTGDTDEAAKDAAKAAFNAPAGKTVSADLVAGYTNLYLVTIA